MIFLCRECRQGTTIVWYHGYTIEAHKLHVVTTEWCLAATMRAVRQIGVPFQKGSGYCVVAKTTEWREQNETRDHEIRIRRTALRHALKRLAGTQPGGNHGDGHGKHAHSGNGDGRRTSKDRGKPLPASKKEKPTESNVTAVAETAAATSVSWKKEPPAQEATIEVGFVIQAPELPKEPAPTEENSTSWQPEPSPEVKISLNFVIQAPEPPKETPEPTPPTEQPLLPEPQPTEPPIEPTPEPEQSEPSQEPTSQQPSDQGFAHCSCGATLSPEELVPHMKGYAMKGESHSYSAH